MLRRWLRRQSKSLQHSIKYSSGWGGRVYPFEMLQCSKETAKGENWHRILFHSSWEKLSTDWLSKSTDYPVAKVKQQITVQATLTFISREFTEPLPCAHPLSELITVSCKAALETSLGQPRDGPLVSSLTGISLGKAPGSRGAARDAFPWNRLCPHYLPGQFPPRTVVLQGVMQESHWASHVTLAKEGYELLVYMISCKTLNVSTNDRRLYLQKGEQPLGAERISELFQVS